MSISVLEESPFYLAYKMNTVFDLISILYTYKNMKRRCSQLFNIYQKYIIILMD